MNADQTQEPSLSTGPDEPLWECLRQYIPEDKLPDFYRVLAHARTLSPDDEILRIIDAMGLLTLLSCEVPSRIAQERLLTKELLDAHLRDTEQLSEQMRQYVADIEARLVALPTDVSAALDANRLAKLLEESTRQTFVASGLPEAAVGWRAAERRLTHAQQVIGELLKGLNDPTKGVLPRLTTSVDRNVAEINKAVNSLHRVMKRVWLPVIAAACLLIGAVGGDRAQSWLDHRESRTSAPVSVDYSGPSMPLRTSASQIQTHHTSRKR